MPSPTLTPMPIKPRAWIWLIKRTPMSVPGRICRHFSRSCSGNDRWQTPTKKGDRSRPFSRWNQNLVLVFHLCTDQITNGGRAGAFHFLLGAQLFHCVLFVFDVFGLDG